MFILLDHEHFGLFGFIYMMASRRGRRIGGGFLAHSKQSFFFLLVFVFSPTNRPALFFQNVFSVGLTFVYNSDLCLEHRGVLLGYLGSHIVIFFAFAF
ncbi:hypothetical protein GGR58DRAFT_250465 [Xylaria digitata]|nr:hypothetical protein GGR58DRAFT_250465 [Xylaria digitata]